MSDVPDMDEAPKVDEMDLVNILFAPSSIQALILDGSESNPNQRIDRQIEVHMRSPTSAWLVLFNDCTQQAVSTALPANLYVLDLMTNIYKEKEEVDDHGHLISVYYNYVRLDTYVQFEVIPSTAAAKVDLQALDFVLSQFTIKEDGTNGSEQEEYRANLLAKGLESSGNAVRQLLRSSGRCTGHVIRYLGATYTSLNTIVRSTSTKEVSSRSLRHAARAKQIGSGIHHSARTLTSTVLYPVRYLASTAVACNPNHTTAGSRSAVGQGLLDVTAGLGNGLTNICKGVTEAMGEMAFAIGDSALHHSRTMHGEQYAEEVTQKYLDACQEVGMAGYKVLNVSSFGVYGIMLDAIIEGSTLFISLYDYLIGPVILQGYMDVVQPPLLTVSRYFVVLRPWSISLYKSSEDFARKPIKIIVTSLLDTLPKLHIKDEPTPEEVVADEVRHAAQAQAMEMEMQDDYLDSAQLPSAEPTMQAEAEHSSSKTAKKSSVLASGGRRLKSILHNWAGGDSSHIELCTLDCSTYLLHPLLPAASDAEDIDEDITIETWYEELQKACKRVETIAKRKSGADDLAMERRLKLFPRSHLLQITVKRLVLNGRKVSGQPASRPLVDSKPEEVKEQEEVKVADDGQVMDVAKEELDRAALLKALEDVDIDDDFVIEDFTVADGALDEVWRSQLSDDESPSATPPTHGVKAEGSEEKAEEELPDAPKEVHQDSSFRRMKDNLVPISLIVIAAPVTQHGNSFLLTRAPL